ncbi:3'(2'),5'-bisphosphate nucleotidase CysQ [Candidatus Terasakiella magnetica]|uniref:3'(2'),5'-bisphosphate nucleotidase CysQ n=1 Tax=Candidatus Terasakiella magnetica TaxID=1867952 RepID=A0A1C3RK36_9PROT|nr:3'(2'),5'-bisphosphate nucleotidase CysQ [Candidatus Terasakiella magnetica]SCA57609.1 3'(2'),5'-bisphosphate nucleotidase CysQ [Candidatus Terasakiella magnetica]
MSFTLNEAVIKKLLDVTRQAGDLTMEIYQTDFEIYSKKDESPVTEADRKAEAIITPVLKALAPDVPVVAEEAFSAGDCPDVEGKMFWLVDPVDGTKQFISKKDEFTVNIALIDENRRPIFGVVHAPALDRMFWGSLEYGAFVKEADGEVKPISVRTAPSEGIVAVVSRSHKTPEVDDYLKDFKVADEVSSGSSIKFCQVAEGIADVYPRFGPTMEWDTGAGQAVVLGAGGTVKTPQGDEFLYGKDGFKNGFFIAKGK